MSDRVPAGNDPHPQPQSAVRDCFAPPAEVCECYCLHCGRTFLSDGIWFQKVVGGKDGFDGFWMCPTANCSGAGFTFDIFPTDPQHPVNLEDGCVEAFEAEEDVEWELEGEEETEWDPAEPHFAAMDEEFQDDEDDLDGEEWKYGLKPGERLPEPQWVVEARREWERTREKYDEPDERPRVLDWSDREQFPESSSISDDDIPF